MKLSINTKYMFFLFIIILNIILRFQIPSREIGIDSFAVHILTNSLSEFGRAKWILDPLSFFGLYPLSYASTVPYFLSGLFQTTGMKMDTVIFIYCLSIGILGIFTTYTFANMLYPQSEVFKFIAVLVFCTSPAILTYTTWSIPTRGLLLILVPLLLCLLLSTLRSSKFLLLALFLSIFLFATHHMFYFVLPSFLAFIAMDLLLKLNKYKLNEKLKRLEPFVIIIGFFGMFCIPFFTGRFLEESRYSPIYISYTRYTGPLIIFSAIGLIYLIFKPKKTSIETFLLLNMIFLTPLIYKETYLKWYIPIFFSPLIAIGLNNIANSSVNKKILLVALVIISSLAFSGYYQFLHEYNWNIDERYIEDSTYHTGLWMKNNIQTSAISNDELFSMRILATAETVHLPTSSAIDNFIYNFVDGNVSNFEYFSMTSEDFYYSTGKGAGSFGQDRWYNFNQMHINPLDYGVNYFVENTRSFGQIVWNHDSLPSKLLHKAYEDSDKVYDAGTSRIWKLNL